MNNYTVPKDVQKLRDALEVERAEYQKVQERVQTAYKKWQKKYESWVFRSFKAAEDKLAFIFHPDFGDNTGQDYYNASQKYIHDRYGLAVMMSGINGVTRQRCVKLLFNREDVENHKVIRQAIDETLPHIIPFSADMKDYRGTPVAAELVGYCYYDIMEHGLSQYASYDVLISPTDKSIVVMKNRYGRIEYSKPMDYDTGLAYLANNLYYESSSSSEDDED